MNRITRLALTVLLAIGLLAACGGSDSDTSGTTTTEGGSTGGSTTTAPSAADVPDPCTLVTTAELQAAFGSPFGEGEATHIQTGGDQCVWTNTDSPPVKTFDIVVQAKFEGAMAQSGETVEQLYDSTRTLLADSSTVEDLDLGEKSFISSTKVYVFQDGVMFSFSTLFGDSAQAVSGLKALATTAMGKV
jgi:hypothetical protein